MKNINSVRLSGTIFWSKLDDKPNYSILRLGLRLNNSSSIFCSISNPNEKDYEIVKPGNKILIGNAWLDIWEARQETQIKAYGSGVQFFKKETKLSDINEFISLGQIIGYKKDIVTIEMIGERNPKTNEWARRRAQIKINDKYTSDIIGKKMFTQGQIISINVDGKSKLVAEGSYDKTTLL